MRDRDSTAKLNEKAARPLSASRSASAPDGDTAPQVANELTDEQLAAISGGPIYVQYNLIKKT